MFCASPSFIEVTTFQAARPSRHQVERREQPRDVERLVVGRRIGRAEPEPLGRHAHRHQQVIGSILTQRMPCATVSAMVARRRGPASPAGRRRSRDGTCRLPAPGRCGGSSRRDSEVGARLRMAPGAGEIGAVLRLQEPDQGHLSHGLSDGALSRTVTPALAQRSSFVGGGAGHADPADGLGAERPDLARRPEDRAGRRRRP